MFVQNIFQLDLYYIEYESNGLVSNDIKEWVNCPGLRSYFEIKNEKNLFQYLSINYNFVKKYSLLECFVHKRNSEK